MDLDTVKNVALWGIIGVAGFGILMAIVVQKIIAKIISLLIAAALVFVGWQQREKVISYAEDVRGKACTSAQGAVDDATTNAATTFLGISISLPDGWCS